MKQAKTRRAASIQTASSANTGTTPSAPSAANQYDDKVRYANCVVGFTKIG